jgi:sugar lactone lactonase YvrE
VSHRALRQIVCSIALLALTLMFAAGAEARLATRVFARVPAPGFPAAAIVGPGDLVYAGTFKSFSAPSDTGPSKVFAYSPAGRLVRTYTVTGQTPGVADAVQVSNVDRAGNLLLLDQDPARVVKLDPRTGRQSTWATFAAQPGGNPPEPDFSAWGPDGSLYVTDYAQALVWRIPPAGGRAQVWLSDPRLNGVVVGPAGIELMADGHTLMLDTGGGGTDPSTGKLYTVPILAGNRPGDLRQLWESAPLEAPDGFAIARSGNVYISLVGPSGNAVEEISPGGAELARITAPASAGDGTTIPFDAPGSVAFDGNELLVANQASIVVNPAHWAILGIDAGEPGLPLSLPPPAPVPRYALTVSPRYVPFGATVTLHFRAVRVTAGHRAPVTRAVVTLAGHRTRTGASGRATLRLHLRRRAVLRARLLVGRRAVAQAIVVFG